MPAANRIDTATRAAPEAATARDAKALVRRALVREGKMRAKLGRLATGCNSGRDFQRVYLRSFPAKVAAVVAAAKALRVGYTDAELIELAKAIDPFRGTREEVRMRAKPKPGGYRPITSFGIKNKALQFLVRSAAEPFIHLNPAQFDARGRGGNPAACRRILELLGQGYIYVVVADIEGNFNALRSEGVKEILPLPPAVTEAVIMARSLNINPNQRRYQDEQSSGSRRRGTTPKAPWTPTGSIPIDLRTLGVITRQAKSGLKHPSRLKETMRKGRRGVSQGSVSSPLFSDAIHEPMVARIARQEKVVHYCDNFFVFAKSKREALRAAKTLQAEFSRSPAGPLLSSDFIIKDARKGFEALGYIFKVKNGRASIRVANHKLNLCAVKFRGMFDDIIARNGMTRKDVVRYLDGWCAAHRLWPHWRLWRKLLMGRLDQHFPPPAEVDG